MATKKLLLSADLKQPIELEISEKKRFAVSDGVYAPGLICLDSEGTITHDPRSDGPESTINLRKAVGFEHCDFDGLLNELIKSGIELKGPQIPVSLSIAEAAQLEQYTRYCSNLGKQIIKLTQERYANE